MIRASKGGEGRETGGRREGEGKERGEGVESRGRRAADLLLIVTTPEGGCGILSGAWKQIHRGLRVQLITSP